jgi:hypothetical protein
VTDPQLREPDNALHDARDALFTAGRQLLTELAELLPESGFHADRMQRWPGRKQNVPGGWVDVPTLARFVDRNGVAGVAATFPVLFPLDGDNQAQVQLQDLILSRGWDLLDAGQRTTVQTVGPAEIDTGGGAARGVVFTVQVRLLASTLCPQRITPDLTT